MTERTLEEVIRNSPAACYVFDVKTLRERVALLRRSLPTSVGLCYAVKANTFLIGELADAVDRFEVCSPGEAAICRKLGIPSEKMVISGVYKTPDVMEQLVKDPTFQGIYTLESMTQYHLLAELARRYHRTLPVLPRLTNDSQFGVNEEDIETMVARRTDEPGLCLRGIQFFSGTQKTSLKKLRRELEHLDGFLQKLEDTYGFEAEELEYGSGFPVAYFESDTLCEEELFAGFSELVTGMAHHPKFTLELGRSIAASCGRYYTHVVDIKCNKGQHYVLVDGGMHQMVYYGQYMAMKQPRFFVVGKENEPKTESANICGSLCTMNDILAKQAPLPALAIGDVLCFENTGAYCPTEGISLFLSRELPAVYLRREDGTLVEVRKVYETAEHNLPHYERKG